MSLYDRLDLAKPSRQLKVPIWERIDLKRPPKPRCRGCRSRIQTNWRICPLCGWLIACNNNALRYCIWVDISGMSIGSEDKGMLEILADAFAKVFSAFRSINVFLTSEPPKSREWEQNFTHVYVFVDEQPVDYLGIASFRHAKIMRDWTSNTLPRT